jgi:multiple sugar transport system permease protein
VRRLLNRIGFGFAVFVMLTPAVSVFLWMLSLSLKNEVDNLAYPPVFIPSPPTLAKFRAVFEQSPYYAGINTVDGTLIYNNRSALDA